MTLEEEFYSLPIYQDFIRVCLAQDAAISKALGVAPSEGWRPDHIDELSVHCYFNLPVIE